MKKIYFKNEDSMVVASNVVGRCKLAWPSTSKATYDGAIPEIHEDEELSDTCSSMAESDSNNSVSELEVFVNIVEPSS